MSVTVPNHEIIIARTEKERQQCLDVRIAVFHIEQKFPLETEIDEFEDGATHFLLRLTPSLSPIGTIRAFKYPGRDYYKLTRLAVLSNYRKYGYGQELVLALHEWVQADGGLTELDVLTGLVQVICHSQLPVKGFYAKFGYKAEGPEFDEDGDPHQKMVISLPVIIRRNINHVQVISP